VERKPPPLSLVEDVASADLVGDVDRKRDDDAAPSVGLDPVGAGTPPADAATRDVVTELRHVARAPGRGYLGDERRELGRELRFALAAEPGKRRARAHDLERLCVADENPDRQVRVKLLEQQNVGGAAPASRTVARRRTAHQARSLLE
jgi:hypothetical protein